MYCGNCGAKNDDGNDFCIQCGANLKQFMAPGAPGAAPGPAQPSAPQVRTPAPARPRRGDVEIPRGKPYEPSVRPQPARPAQDRPAAPVRSRADAGFAVPRPADPARRQVAPSHARPSGNPTSGQLPSIVADRPRSSFEPHLTLIRSNGTRYRITEFPALVGKGSAANVRIGGNTAISRVHASIAFLGTGFSIEDKASTNGTGINGNALAPGERVKLNDGDRITLGDEDFIVEIK